MERLTPLMEQYWEIKRQHPDKLVFFRMGDFYELFHRDAEIAAPLLNISLTFRNRKAGDHTPMCGVPHHSIAGPINKLLQHGFKVALCDQLEDPSQAKGLVKRGVTRILTPGMVFDPSTLPGEEPHWVAGFKGRELVIFDPTTGSGYYFEPITSLQAREILRGLKIQELVLFSREDQLQFEVGSITFYEDVSLTATAREALIGYLHTLIQKDELLVIKGFEKRDFQIYLRTHPELFRHLEVFPDGSTGSVGSVFEVVHRTVTPMGSRQLKDDLKWPTRSQESLRMRHERIEWWLKNWGKVEKAIGLLKSVGDLSRKLARVSQNHSTPRDLKALVDGLILSFELSCYCGWRLEWKEGLEELAWEVTQTLREELPLSSKDGLLIRKGVSAELDEWIELTENTQVNLQRLEEKERKRTGIPSLKIRYNQVFGYYIEVTQAHLDKVPSDYKRKQTLAQAERFTNAELEHLERKIVEAQSQRNELEYQIYESLRQRILGYSQSILSISQALAFWDVAFAGAQLILEKNYSLPIWSSDSEILALELRHPVVEAIYPSKFIANDLLIKQGQLHLLTGPNMAGKSTWMRSIAINALLAHCGLPVAAREMRLPLLDGIFSRIGASDRLALGQSTFMVEMSETQTILHSYGPLSLVVLDEIGRGTSTFDGMALAQAICEYLVKNGYGFIFFATHYHELSKLEDIYPQQVINYHLKIEDSEDQLQFLYRLERGRARKSYGIKVAKLSGLPNEVILRAEEILRKWEEGSTRVDKPSQIKITQLDLF